MSTRSAVQRAGSTGARDTIGLRVRGALAQLRKATGVELAFCGRVDDGTLDLTDFDGALVGPLRGATLAAGHGLGGRVLVQKRAVALADYLGARSIVHTYDEIIRAEQVRALVAAPVIVGREHVAVLYAATRVHQSELGRLFDAVTQETRALEQTLAIADVLRYQRRNDDAPERATARARITGAYAELRALASSVGDARVRSRLMDIADGLAQDHGSAGCARVHLTEREQDVLALMSNGLSNRAIGERLGIGLYTVKGYVKSLMVKLSAGSRMETVVNARLVALLP